MPIQIFQPPQLDEDVLEQVIDDLSARYIVQQLVAPISYTDTTGDIGTLDENVVVLDRAIVRTTPWNATPTFTLGTAMTADLFVKNNQHQLSAAGAGVTRIVGDGYRTTASTPVRATWNQNGATAGAGYVVITYARLDL